MEFTMIETGWLSILPPIIAIALALITKEVYSSLFIGLFSGMLIYSFAGGGTIISAVATTFDMMYAKIADNAYMIIFLALLWAVVSLVSKSGGSEAYGRWAEKRLKTKRSASFATSLLGVLIFIDDGFNCLTVGTVMRPITDRLRISREKLAYVIDATAAPVCIIAPVSSWAVAVASEVSQTNGFNVFLSTIPYNLYALLTILMVLFICWTGKDFGPMKRAELAAKQQTAAGDSGEARDASPLKGRVIDLVLPIFVLIVCAILGMAYVGGFFRGTPLLGGDRLQSHCRPDAWGFRRTSDRFLAVHSAQDHEAQRVHDQYRQRYIQYCAAYVDPDPVLELGGCLPSADRDGRIHLRLREYNQSSLGLFTLFDLCHCCRYELLHGYFLGDLRYADSDRHDDLCRRWRGRAADSHSGSNAGRLRVRRPLFPDLRYNDPGFYRRILPAYPSCGNTAAVCHFGSSGVRGRLSDCRIHANTVDRVGGRRRAVDCNSFGIEQNESENKGG